MEVLNPGVVGKCQSYDIMTSLSITERHLMFLVLNE